MKIIASFKVFIFLLFAVLINQTLVAQTIGTHTFEAVTTGVKASSTSGSTNWADAVSGLTFINSGGAYSIYVHQISVSNIASSINSRMLSFDRTTGGSTSPTVDLATIKSTSGNEFRFTSLNVALITAGARTLTFSAYRNGTLVGSTTQSVNSSTTKTAVTLPAGSFSNVDEIRISGFAQDGIRVDDLVLAALNTPPTTPADNNPASNTLPENSTAGTLTGITAFSTDAQGSTVVYSLLDDANGRFVINSATGVVTATGLSLNYETATTQSITVQASDELISSTQTFSIAITDVNEAPSITSLKTLTIAENTQTVITVTATDPDAGSIFSYSIGGGSDASLFTINSAGVLSFKTAPNYELPEDANGDNIYEVYVKVTDNGSPTLFDNDLHLITVTDVNENYVNNYAFRKTLTLNGNTLGISSNQTNFPALLRIQDNALIIAGNCADKVNSASAPNFAFEDPGNPGTELNYEIESYNSSTGTVLVWVKIPTLKWSATTPIYFYFGSNTTLTSHDDAFAKATWSSVTSGLKSFKGVWHFSESAGAAAPQFKDASSNNNSLTKTATGVTQNATSIIGNGINLSSGAVANTAVAAFPALNSSYTVSVWANYPATPSSNANIVAIQNAGGSIGTQLGYTTSNGINAWRWAASGTAMVKAAAPSASAWHHYVYSYNGTSSSLYIDGILANSSSVTAPMAGSPNAIVFGAYYTAANAPSEYFSGAIDEAQIIDAALTADWIKASYNNQKDPTSFTSNGTLEVTASTALANSGYLVYTWTGAQNSIISNANNWTNSTSGVSLTPVPANKANWIIPAGLSNYPALDGNYTINGLTIASGASLNLNGYTLNVACNILNSGTISNNNNTGSKISFNGAASAQSYTGNSGSNSCVLSQLEVNNTASGTVTLSGGQVQVYDLVAVNQGNLNANGFLTLKSTATSSASIGPLNGTTVSGNVNVESYFTGGSVPYRSTRIISPPINETSLTTKFFAQLKNYIVITGPGGATNGFDPGGTLQPSAVTLTKYNEPATLSQSQFTNVASISEALLPGNAAFIYYRGNRSGYTAATAATSTKVNSPYATPESTTVTYTGPINQGDVTANLSYTNNPGDTRNGYNLVGNPYPAVINWENVTRNNVANELKIIKPSGGYATYLNGISTNAGGLGLNYIQPGQGFYARATSAGASVTFKESSKSVNSTPVRLLYRNSEKLLDFQDGNLALNESEISFPVIRQLRINLQDETNIEEAVSVFQAGAGETAGTEDALFFGGSTISLSTLSSENTKLAINFMPELEKVKELKLSIGSSSAGNLKLNFTDLSAAEGYNVYLLDSFTGAFSDIRSTPTYSFTVNPANTATLGDNRFKLQFSPVTTLPVQLVSFEANAGPKGVLLKWETSFEPNANRFEIERSADKLSFETVATVKAKGNAKAGTAYSHLDEKMSAGDVYYRLKMLDNDGAIKYSKVVLVREDYAGTRFLVYPNPATDKIVIYTENLNEDVNVSIIDLSGKQLRNTYYGKGSLLEENVSLLPAGVYVVRVTDSMNNIIGTQKFIRK